jgi:hypothetical protein
VKIPVSLRLLVIFKLKEIQKFVVVLGDRLQWQFEKAAVGVWLWRGVSSWKRPLCRIDAIKASNCDTFEGLTYSNAAKYCPDADETIMGHLAQHAKTSDLQNPSSLRRFRWRFSLLPVLQLHTSFTS